MIGSGKRLFAALAGILVLAMPAAAQQATATVTGRVTGAGRAEPLEEVRVLVVGTNVFTTTNADGRYVLRNVPVGSQTLRVLRVGFQEQRRAVTAVAGETVTADFQLAMTVVQLQEIVTTATGETQRRRETGASVSTIDTSALQMAAVPNLSAVLAARAPGVMVTGAAGTTGAASRIRIRGSNSISLNNDPLLIIDGVRVNNASASTSIGVGGQSPSRFNDINPEEIETIDVIKGPAAAALYGTAAANGVIQITTKKGRAGRTRWDAFVEAGTLDDVNEYPGNFLRFGTRLRANGQDSVNTAGANVVTSNCNIDLQARRVCRPDSLVTTRPLENANPFRTGNRRNVGLSATGGTANNTYFLSAELDREQGIYDPNSLRKLNVRTNLRSQLTSKLDASVSIGFTNSNLRQAENDNNLFGYISSSLLGKAADCSPTKAKFQPLICGVNAQGQPTDTLSRGFAATAPPQTFFAVDTRQEVQRTTGSITSNYLPLSWLSFNGTLGADLAGRFDHQTVPPNVIPATASATRNEGFRAANRAVINTYTANGSGTAKFNVTEDLNSSTSVGVQYNHEYFTRTDAFGARLLAGTNSLAGTSARFSVGEFTNENKTLGFILGEQLAFRDRLYLTAAARTDRNSAFGENFGWVVYPAVNASWVISEEEFFPTLSFVNSLRLRSGYGSSGQRPSFRDPLVFFEPVAVNVGGVETPGFTRPGVLGNVNLRPEFSTELEGGFDLALLENRINIEYSHYNKVTKDALVQVPLAPSLGAGNLTFQNLGRVRNWGDEIGLRASVFDTRWVGLDLNANFSFTRNKLEDLGRDPQGNPLPTIFQGFNSTQRIQTGYPLGAYFQRQYTFNDLNGDRIISRVNCGVDPLTDVRIGPDVAGGPACELAFSDTSSAAQYMGSPFPTREINVTPMLRIGPWVQLQALVDHRGGHKLFNSTREFRCTSAFQNCIDVADPSRTSLEDQARAIAVLGGNTRAGYVEDASYTKLRELSATFRLPERLAQRARAASASLTFAGRNLYTWTKYTGFDPEVNALNAGNFTTADFLTQPQVRYFTSRLSLTF